MRRNICFSNLSRNLCKRQSSLRHMDVPPADEGVSHCPRRRTKPRFLCAVLREILQMELLRAYIKKPLRQSACGAPFDSRIGMNDGPIRKLPKRYCTPTLRSIPTTNATGVTEKPGAQRSLRLSPIDAHANGSRRTMVSARSAPVEMISTGVPSTALMRSR